MAKRKRKEPVPVEASTGAIGIDTAVSTAESAWRVVGTAIRGVSHERLDLPCQDAQAFLCLPGGLLLVAVADGAGSACCSEIGAQAAVVESMRLLENSLHETIPADRAGWEALLRAAAQGARSVVIALAEDAGDAPRNYASTLTLAAAGAHGLVVGQIGDGAVVATGSEGALFTATRLQRGEYANETHFLIQEDALEHLIIDVFEPPITALAVMSDGLIRLALKLPDQSPHAPFFEPLFRFLHAVTDPVEAEAQLGAFLASARVNARTDDDKALVLAAWMERGQP